MVLSFFSSFRIIFLFSVLHFLQDKLPMPLHNSSVFLYMQQHDSNKEDGFHWDFRCLTALQGSKSALMQ